MLSVVWTVIVLLGLSLAQTVSAATYYVGPNGGPGLSTASTAPGSLGAAVANAPDGSTVVLENGTYDGAPSGFTVAHARVTFRAQHWHGATVTNSTGAHLWGPAPGAVNDTCQGIVFGPCVTPTSGGWSGGGGDGWQFLDCEFTKNDGMGFGNDGLVLHCLFTDQWINSFDVNNVRGFIMRNSIVRRGNRHNADDDSTGNKCDLAPTLTFDGLVDYDNQGAGLWFDTNNTDWTVKNCTFFANHGGNNWYNLTVVRGAGTGQFAGNGQDGAGVSVGAHLMAIAGTAANLNHETTVTAVTNYNPMILTVSLPLPASTAAGDDFAVQQGHTSAGCGLMSEANPNGTFINNVTYNNTDGGLFDADSGDGYGVTHGGLQITGNQFAYDGLFFRAITGGPKDPTRKLGPATVRHNTFQVGPLTSRDAFRWGGTNWLEGFPGPHYGIDFDDNTYDAAPGYTGPWADWYLWAGGPKTNYQAYSLADLQNVRTFDQDHHSKQGPVILRGPTVPSYLWPASSDNHWSDIFFPNNAYGTRNSIHQVHDDEAPYINRAIAGKSRGSVVRLTVFGHTSFLGSGPYTCEVYDYSGRYVQLTMRGTAAREALDAAVPGYAVLRPSTIAVTLTSNPLLSPYHLTAAYGVPTEARHIRKSSGPRL